MEGWSLIAFTALMSTSFLVGGLWLLALNRLDKEHRERLNSRPAPSPPTLPAGLVNVLGTPRPESPSSTAKTVIEPSPLLHTASVTLTPAEERECSPPENDEA